MLEDLGKYYYLQGLMLAAEKRITPAVTALERAVAFQEDNWKSWNVMGLCYYRLGRFGCAKNAWEQSLLYCSNQNRAELYLDYLKSSDFFNLCEKYNQGLVLARKGQYQKAEIILEDKRLLDIVPFANFVGLCLYARGKKKKAFQVWRESLSMDRDCLSTVKYIQNCGLDYSVAELVSRFLKNIFSRR